MSVPVRARRNAAPAHRFLPIAAFAATFLAAPPSHAQQSDVAALREEMRQMRAEYARQIEALRQAYEARMADLEKRVAAPPAAAAARPSPATASSASAFNPAIGVILNGTAASLSQDPGGYLIRGFALGEETAPGERGLSLGETEVNFSANIDHVLYGSLTVALTPENEAEVEEAFIQTTSLPEGFTLKGGRFFSGIGYLNEKHAHNWDFVDQPLPYRAMLANQYRDDGAQLRWLAPLDLFFEVGGELMRGDGFPAAGAHDGIGAWTAFGRVGGDIGASHSWRLGASYLDADADGRATNDGADLFRGTSKLVIVDAVYKWAPDGNPTDRNLTIAGELFLGEVDGEFNGANFGQQQRGWYAQAVYQFMPRWRVGVRYDEVWARGAAGVLAGTALDDAGLTPYRMTGMIDFSTSEFGRFRFQYNNDRSNTDADHQFYLQYTVSLGAHGAHGY
jgi:hypothetical protein